MNQDRTPHIHLRRTEENSAEIDGGRDASGEGRPRGVLDHLNRQAERRAGAGPCRRVGLPVERRDATNERWWPQGITTSADASDTEDIDGRRLLVTSWYSKTLRGANHGSRVTIVDIDSLALPARPARRTGDRRPTVRSTLDPLLVHAGGLVWCGPYLHVAGTRRGLFSCLLDDIVRVRDLDDAFGYRYVLPVRFAYEAAAEDGVEQMRYSFLSLDRGSNPPQLVAGEYGRGEMTRRLVRYPLDPATFHLAAEEDGASRPVWLRRRGARTHAGCRRGRAAPTT